MKNGIINVYKEAGYTSHDVVAKLRGIFGQKKIGHTGTLDPDATGVLPVCLGKATKVCDLLTEKEKTYQCVMLLGTVTDTQDTSGKILKEMEVCLKSEEVIETILKFQGEYQQIPPMYSALKVHGKKLYELAREGIEIERKARNVIISNITIKKIELPRVTMEVTCSKGTYIRTLCHDIGSALGCGACMEKLVRTRVDNFTLEESYSLDQIEKIQKDGKEERILIPVERLFLKFPKIQVKEHGQKFLENGNRMHISLLEEWKQEWESSQLRVYDFQDRFVGIYQYQQNQQDIKPIKIFWEKDSQS